MKVARFTMVSLLVSALSGCAAQDVSSDSDHYVPATRTIMPAPKIPPIDGIKNSSAVMTSSNMMHHPKVMLAYKNMLKTGIAQTIKGDGFITLPFDAYKRPVLTCAPLLACEIVLQQGEKVNSVLLGDTLRWQIKELQVGEGDHASPIIAFKPTELNIATNMSIMTNKRIYQFGLVSKTSAVPEVVNFWYPQEMLQATHSEKIAENKQSEQIISTEPHVNLDRLNFNYRILGDHPTWYPTRVFDDGVKTFILLSPHTGETQLPVLYTRQGKSKVALVNYRYRRPYMIVDGLFTEARLISGKGSRQEKVIIRNAGRLS